MKKILFQETRNGPLNESQEDEEVGSVYLVGTDGVLTTWESSGLGTMKTTFGDKNVIDALGLKKHAELQKKHS